MPSTRRNVCARRSRPARAPAFLGRPGLCLRGARPQTLGDAIDKQIRDRCELQEPVFKGLLHKLGVGRREAVLGGERLLRPYRGAVSRSDVPKRGQQVVPQRGRWLGVEGARPLAAAATLSIAGLVRNHPRLSVPWLRRGRWRARTITKIGSIQVVLAGDANQREQSVPAGVGQGRAHAWGLTVSAMGQTGQSDAIHSPEACASVVVKLTIPAAWSMAVVCTVAISCWPSVLRTMSRPLERGA